MLENTEGVIKNGQSRETGNSSDTGYSVVYNLHLLYIQVLLLLVKHKQ